MLCQVNYLREFGLNTDDLGRLLAHKPQLMGCSIEERWKPLVKYLYYLGVDRDGMRRILLMKPMVFCVDLETTIAPKVLNLLMQTLNNSVCWEKKNLFCIPFRSLLQSLMSDYDYYDPCSWKS